MGFIDLAGIDVGNGSGPALVLLMFARIEPAQRGGLGIAEVWTCNGPMVGQARK
jgi:hypothetical protein